jgi:4-hydroxybenzoyl-CoA thioesterase/acyl-CoA thioester hydrolase
LGGKSVTYAFEFTCAGRPVAKGKITAVCCRLSADHPPTAIRIPDWMADRLRTYAANG